MKKIMTLSWLCIFLLLFQQTATISFWHVPKKPKINKTKTAVYLLGVSALVTIILAMMYKNKKNNDFDDPKNLTHNSSNYQTNSTGTRWVVPPKITVEELEKNGRIQTATTSSRLPEENKKENLEPSTEHKI